MNDKKMKILINKSHESINVKEELRGELLDAEDSISSKIEKVPADNHIHILVQLPPPATTGKCLPMVYLSNKKFALSHIFFIRLGTLSIPMKSDKQNHSAIYSLESTRGGKQSVRPELRDAKIQMTIIA